DGQLTSAVAPATAPINYDGLGNLLAFGRNGNAAVNNFGTAASQVAQLDDVAIFNRALTSGEVAALAGAELPGGFGPHIATDIQGDMLDVNSSVYTRIPFNVDDPTDFNQLFLSVAYDDGFAAFINGQEVMRVNAPVLGEEEIDVFDATATRAVSDFGAVEFERFDISDSRDALRVGENVLAIQGLNRSADNPDFLLSAKLDGGLITLDLNNVGYLTTPTPGELNVPSTGLLGPVITDVTETVLVIEANEPIVVTATVQQTLNPIGQVDLIYRVMFGAESTLAMNDSGTDGDVVAGDGIYTATIPGGVGNPGEMVRWYVSASDDTGSLSRAPEFLFRTGNNQSPQYYGTVVNDPSIVSDIHVLHWFVQDTTNSENRTGTRASLYFEGEFYDNVYVRQRGGSTASSAESRGKTNYKFDFKGDTFRFDPNFGRVEEFNLNSTASDKAYIRQSLAFETYSLAGVPSSKSFPMHVRRNDQFYGVFAFIEEPDANLLKREGIDPNGALYKMYNSFNSTNVRKKTREFEGTQDLADFQNQVNNVLSGEDLSNYLFDNLNIPAVLNYHVATVLTHQNDNPHKNHFMYRDTEGTGEWMFLPWDHDLTFGSNWVGTSYSDTIYSDDDSVPGRAANVKPSHPFINDSDHREWNNNWNRLTEAIFNDPRLTEMYLRRLRSVMDALLGNPELDPESTYLNQRLNDYLATMSPDAAADKARWNLTWGASQTFEQAVDIIKNEYLAVRREHLYVTHSINNVGSSAEPVIVPAESVGTYFVPGDNSLGTSWTEVGFDDASWTTGESAYGYDDGFIYNGLINTQVRPTQTHPDSTSIFVRTTFDVSDLEAYSSLTLRMRFDDGMIAYLNGVEVARSNVTGTPGYNADATNRTFSQALTPLDFDITQHLGLLTPTDNVLAFHAINSSGSTNNMLLAYELFDSTVVPPNDDVAGIPDEQALNPQINFDPVNYDANPISGNQDEEYLKLDNPNDTAVDISGWRLEGGIEYTFAPGTVIISGDSVYVSPHVRSFRARTTGPSGGQGLFVQGAYQGHLSNFGETV
ncbi:MAG: CotH kinase family protein, partial [Planctomycetales bacterium]|nr:CotH kinase family protein [Planctomycetales bacterium]